MPRAAVHMPKLSTYSRAPLLHSCLFKVQRPFATSSINQVLQSPHITEGELPGHPITPCSPGAVVWQGMNFLAGLLLVYLPREDDAYGALVLLMQQRGLRELYTTDMSLLQVRQGRCGGQLH